jgi:two-component system sensor histidine kinase QseC
VTRPAQSFVIARWQSLRFRLVASMLLVFLLAVATAGLFDRLDIVGAVSPDEEPYQDGLVLACFSLAVLVLIWVVSQWSLRPLSRASAEAAQAGPQNPGLRLSATRLPSEIRPLVDAVNGALDRMEAAYQAERRFTSDAAHELRTPLSVLSLRLQRARLEGGPDWGAIDTDMRQMTHLVTSLLDLARKEQAGRDVAAQPVNFARIAREAAAMIAPLADQAGRALHVDLPENLPVRGRADDLRDMILNLLDNALAHGSGTIGLQGRADPPHCILDVSDEGPALPNTLAASMFERFRKAQPSSPGIGLGLAIVRQVAESHGGTARFVPAPTCQVRIEIPAAAP